MRKIALLAALFALLPASAASAAGFIYDIPELVAKPLAAVNRGTNVPVLLPSRMTTEHRKLFSAGKGRKNHYEIEIGAVRNCHSATACFVADFRAKRGAKASGKKVRLAEHTTGYFHPTSCGASCASPGIEWVHDGVWYSIEAKLGTKKSERKILTRLADSAIKNGPR